jgi:hypothetical protein
MGLDWDKPLFRDVRVSSLEEVLAHPNKTVEKSWKFNKIESKKQSYINRLVLISQKTK